jgi:glycosyltransferase involved in cell wall biosynthesis
MQPLISVIIATYNAEAFLAEALESVLAQTYRNFELIVIDGGSRDGTLAILNRYRPHLAYVVSEPDRGVYDAWNKGLAVAKGEWITFLGSDDSFLPDAFASYVRFLEASPERFDLVSSKGWLLKRQSDEVLGRVGFAWEWKGFQRRMTIAHPGAFHHRGLFQQYGGFDVQYRIAADFELLLRSGKNLRAGFIDAFTVRIRQGGMSDTLQVRPEHFRVVTRTGRLSPVVAGWDFVWLSLRAFKKKLLAA